MTEARKSTWHGLWALSLGLLVLLTLGIRYAEPVRDGDLWWQMAYGRYLLEHRTLIPDHTVFTWTPADSSAIYCAWLSEIFLFLLYEVGGFPVLMVIWVNSHGGFIFGVAFLFVIGLGEALNTVISPKEAISPGLRKHFFAALPLS